MTPTTQPSTVRRPVLKSALLWTLAVILTLLCFTYQDRTGPTYPLEGDLQTARGPVHFKLQRSETIGRDLAVMLVEPVPEGVSGYVEYRRFRSDDPWRVLPLRAAEYETSRRGRTESVRGLGTALPSLAERAGKYEYRVFVDDGAGEPISVTGTTAVQARYKAEVPIWILTLHIFTVFASMTLAIRTVLETLTGGRYGWMIWATVASLLLGAFALGPAVQWYAFGVLWAGIPFGYDWTDNKVLLELAFWLAAAWLNRGTRRNASSVYAAGLVTLVVYFIPHSVFGSEYDYRTGTGRGTVG